MLQASRTQNNRARQKLGSNPFKDVKPFVVGSRKGGSSGIRDGEHRGAAHYDS